MSKAKHWSNKVDIRNNDGSINWDKAAALTQAIDAERTQNFASVDPETCTHGLVYNKQGDDMHCHYCDKFMYDESKD